MSKSSTHSTTGHGVGSFSSKFTSEMSSKGIVALFIVLYGIIAIPYVMIHKMRSK